MAVDYKQTIIDELSVLEHKERQERNIFKARAYDKVISELKIYPDKITSIKDIDNIQGVGVKIRAKIEEIINTGVLKAAQVIKANKKTDITNQLMDIHGIGPVKAKQLVSEYNIKTIEELRNLVEKNPKILNDKQKIGLTYYEVLQERIPRDEMREHEKILKRQIPSTLKMDVVGSYRRGKPDSGDIDVLIGTNTDMNEKEISKLFKNIVEELQKTGYITEILALGPKKCMAICKINENSKPRRLDLLVTPPNEYAYALFYFTGSDKFNIRMRKIALEKGYTLNEHRMLPVREGISPAPFMKDEKAIFDFLEQKYVKPEDRG